MPPIQVSEPWHIKREVQLGHIISTLTVAASAVVWAGKVDQRIAIVENQLVVQHERDERQDKTSHEMDMMLLAQFEKIDAKLDRLIESKRGGK